MGINGLPEWLAGQSRSHAGWGAWQSAVFGPPQRLASTNDVTRGSRIRCRLLYRARNLIERFFNKIKQCRRVATRYHKLAANYGHSSSSHQSAFGCALWVRAL